MNKPILFVTPGSPPSRSIVMVAKYLGIEVDIRVMDFSKREHFSEAYLKLNPAHQVPTFVDGDFVLTESRAILAYLVNSRQQGSDLYPIDPKARARVDQRLSFDHVLFTKNRQLVWPPLHNGAKSIPQSSRDEIRDALLIVETFLQNFKWIAGDNLTIADFSTLATVTSLVEMGYDLSQHPNIARWFKQCQSLDEFEENRIGAASLALRVKNAVEGPIFL